MDEENRSTELGFIFCGKIYEKVGSRNQDRVGAGKGTKVFRTELEGRRWIYIRACLKTISQSACPTFSVYFADCKINFLHALDGGDKERV